MTTHAPRPAPSDLDRALDEVSAASSGGAPFLFAFGLTLGATGLAAFWLPVKTAALIALFQGNVALPLAFLIERRLRLTSMAGDNPLRPLSVQLAMSQIAALPAVLLLYYLAPWTVPFGLACTAAAHLVPYAWLQRTRVYLVVSVVLPAGAGAITLALWESALPWTLLWFGAVYWGAVPLLYRRSRALLTSDWRPRAA